MQDKGWNLDGPGRPLFPRCLPVFPLSGQEFRGEKNGRKGEEAVRGTVVHSDAEWATRAGTRGCPAGYCCGFAPSCYVLCSLLGVLAS